MYFDGVCAAKFYCILNPLITLAGKITKTGQPTVPGDESWDELASSLTLAISDTQTDHLPVGLSEALGIDPCDDSQDDLDLGQIQDVVDCLTENLKREFRGVLQMRVTGRLPFLLLRYASLKS